MSNYSTDKDSELVAEIIATHYTNIFLIHLFEQATKYAGTSPGVSNITEGYKTALLAYKNSISRPDFTSVTVSGFYHQFLKVNDKLRRNECIYKILYSFFPKEAFDGIIKNEQLIEKALIKIVYDVTHQILCSVPVKHFKNIIDNNNSKSTSDSMQSDFHRIVTEHMERNQYDFINKKKAQYHNPETNYNMFEKAKADLAKVTNEKAELEAKLSIMQKQMIELQSRNHDLMEKTGVQTTRIRELESQNKLLQSRPHITQSTGLIQTATVPPQYAVHEPVNNEPVKSIHTEPPPQQKPIKLEQKPVEVPPISTPKPKRDYSHLLNDVNSDSDNDDNTSGLISSARLDDEYDMNLNMFNK